MNITIQELSDGRFVGCGVLEIDSFPDADSFGLGSSESVSRTAELFRQAIQEFYRLGLDGNTCAEFLWITERAERQAFRSRVRIFLILRRISASRDAAAQTLSSLQANFSTLMTSRRYGISVLTDDFEPLQILLRSTDSSCVYSVIKAEKFSGNALSPYPYYYCDVLPGGNVDNFDMLVAALGQSEDCCVSFQLFPTTFTENELYFMNEQVAELGRIASGMVSERQFLRDEAAAEPQRVLAHYVSHTRSPLFQYNILVFGRQPTCAGLATKILSLLQAGKTPVSTSDCGCLDLSGEHLDLPAQFVFYPWNINNRLIYAYRNRQVIQSLRSASILFRLPYIMTADEASAFSRLPLHNKAMTALRSNQASQAFEQFEAAVTDQNSIRLGMLLSSPTVSIGCPEKAFTKHALVVGTPGSGKTTFSVNLLLQFARRDIPFLAIEPTKTEYRAMIDAIEDLRIFTPGNNAVSPFIVNPFIPPRGIRIEQYIPSLASAFEAAFSMPSPLDILFLRAVRACYTEHGWKDYSQLGDPDVTVFGLHEFIRSFKRIIASSSYSREVKGNIESGGVFRLLNLIEQNSNIYDTIHTVPIEDLLRAPTVLELNSIDNTEQKALIMALLLINICIFTKSNQLGDGKLKNVILIDEAHVLLAGGASRTDGADSQGTTVRALQNMIAEIRSYGTSIIVADQSPTKVSREIVANTDIKVSFRLVQSDEKELIADSTNMDTAAMQQLSRLRPGEAYVYYSRLEMPQLVMTDDIRANEGIRLAVPNEEIARRMTYWDTRKKLLRPYAECALCADCQTDCDFALRAQADYFAARLYDKNASLLKDSTTLKRYLLQFDALMHNAIQDIPRERRQRLVNCTRLKFLRKMELETPLTLTKRELAAILLPNPEAGKGDLDG